MPTPDPIVIQMRAQRERLNLSLPRAAQRCNMPAIVIGSYERGDRQPPLFRLRGWVEALDFRLLAVPTGASSGAPLRIEYAVAYNGEGLIECDTQEEAADIAALMPGARVVTRTVRVSEWQTDASAVPA